MSTTQYATQPGLPAPPVAGKTPKTPGTKKPQPGESQLEEIEDERLPWYIAWFRESPAMLVSAVFHAALLLILALFAITTKSDEGITQLLASTTEVDTEIEELESLEIEQPLEDLEKLDAKVDTVPFKIEDPGAAAFGEVTSTNVAVADVGDIGASDAIGEIGALFGTGGKGWAKSGNGIGSDILTSFCGVKAKGNRFLYILDNSNSMSGGKFDSVAYELVQSIDNLTEKQFFYVYLFSDQHYRLFHPTPARGWVPATYENKERLRYWLETVILLLQTRAHDAVLEGVNLNPKPSVAFILSDGRFTDDTYPMMMAMPNLGFPINTIQVDKAGGGGRGKKGGKGVDQLQGIAQRFGGVFRSVILDPRKTLGLNPSKNKQGSWGQSAPIVVRQP